MRGDSPGKTQQPNRRETASTPTTTGPGMDPGSGTTLVHLLHSHHPIDERGQLWMELWTPEQHHLIAGQLVGSTLRAGSLRPRLWTLYNQAFAKHSTGGADSPPSTPQTESDGTPPSPTQLPPTPVRHRWGRCLQARHHRLHPFIRTRPTTSSTLKLHRHHPQPPSHNHYLTFAHTPPSGLGPLGPAGWWGSRVTPLHTALVPRRTHCIIQGLRSRTAWWANVFYLFKKK